MKKSDVRIGETYEARVSGKLARVRIDAEETVPGNVGWRATNLDTGYFVRIRTAGRLRKPVGIAPPTSVADLWRQWQALKASNPGTVLLFRVEDYFEAYGDDATVCGETLGLEVLHTTNRAPKVIPTPLVSFPHGCLADYIPKLAAAGHKVAVCERVQAGEAKGKPVEKIIIPV